jgi:CheY-like chemotaxis protein
MLAQLANCPDRPALMICDYRLRAHEDGINVIERLRAEYNDDDIPGMLITGDTAPDRLREAQESGLLLLHKPVSNSRLRAAISHLVAHPVAQHPAIRAENALPVSG